jgi:hypothetical protein
MKAMRRSRVSIWIPRLLTLALLGAVAGAVSAQTTVTLPNTAQTATLTATVSEQARVNLPTAVAFAVGNTSAATTSSAQTVTIDQIVLTAGNKLKLSMKANATAFTPPTAGDTTWAPSDISWNAAAWTTGTGATGTLNNDAATYTEVATSGANAATLSSSALTFTLAAKAAVVRAGAHTLAVTWKVESIP